MKTRILASFVTKEGYNEIGDREIGLDECPDFPVNSVEDGRKLIKENELNGVGTITEEKLTKYGWEDVATHYVDEGIIYATHDSDGNVTYHTGH